MLHYLYFLINLFIFIYFFTLQYYIGFAIHQHASAMGVHMFPILYPPPTSLPSPPSGWSQCTSPKLPVSCIEAGLAIRFLYDIIHVLMPFSQIIAPLPLPQSPKDCSIHLQADSLCIKIKKIIIDGEKTGWLLQECSIWYSLSQQTIRNTMSFNTRMDK